MAVKKNHFEDLSVARFFNQQFDYLGLNIFDKAINFNNS